MNKQTENRKNRVGIVYSTNPEFSYLSAIEGESETLIPAKQNLRVSLDKKQRKGKEVVIISGFIGKEDDIQKLSRLLKTQCGAGGTVKNDEILIQGNFCDKIIEILRKEGYNAKRTGGQTNRE